jgi:hypothetical protein
MTIKDCIDIVDNIKPNQYTIKDKVMWLSFLDEIIINDVLKTHEGYDGRYDDFDGYSEDKLTITLIVPSPYDRLYTAYLKMKIDAENGETARYNNSASLYNTYLDEYKKHYNKTHMPLDVTAKRKLAPVKGKAIGLSDAEYEKLVRDLTFILAEHFAETISEDKVKDIVTGIVQTNAEMLKGKDGYTPKKGVDYFTDDEVEQIKADAKGDAGYSPVVKVSETEEGHNVIIADAEGISTFFVTNGKDGFCPVIRVSDYGNGQYRMMIAKQEGVDAQLVYWNDGKDGISPIITAEETENGHTVSVQDARGITKFDVKNGVGVRDVRQTTESMDDGGVNVYTVTLTDGTSTHLHIRNGSKGSKGDIGEAFTYEDFTPEQLVALTGPKGDRGEKGEAFTYDDFTPEQLANLKGEKGDAFTYDDFTPEQLGDLKGEKGDTGEKGEKGEALTYEDLTETQKGEILSGVTDVVSNALVGKATGGYLIIPDVSPIAHDLKVKVTENAEVKVVGKNIFNQENVNGDGSGLYKYWLINPHNKNVTLSLKDKDTSVDISNVYFGFTATGSDATTSTAFPIRWAIERGAVKNTEIKGVTNAYLSCYPLTAMEALNKRFYIQCEYGDVNTEYVPFDGGVYTPDAEGNVLGVHSRYPFTTIYTDNSEAVIEAEYNRDINKAFAEITQAIISLGGNV